MIQNGDLLVRMEILVSKPNNSFVTSEKDAFPPCRHMDFRDVWVAGVRNKSYLLESLTILPIPLAYILLA